MVEDEPVGQRFSQVYLRPEALAKDSTRARKRLSALLTSDDEFTDHLADYVHHELGVSVPIGYDRYMYGKFIETCQLRDLLDVITLVHRQLRHRSKSSEAELWLKTCRRIIAEESLGYRIDDKGGVHFAVDAEFEGLRVAAVRELGAARYRAVLDAFEQAHRNLDGSPPDFKSAVRSAFEAVEILFKLICDRAPRLGSAEIRQYLNPIVEAGASTDATANRVSAKMLRALGEWADGVHFYRHGEKTEEPKQPTPALATFILSQAAAYLRWLSDIDRQAKA